MGRKPVDLTGQRFGHLTVIQLTDKRISRQAVWQCQCDCGKICEVLSNNLRQGYTKSCGCSFKVENIGSKPIDLTGQRFGHLTVVKITDKRSSIGSVIWQCKCDCGKICEVSSQHLKDGHTQSCGCSNQSHGEFIIEKILKENNIPFISEYQAFKFPITGGYARFDFYVDNRYLIEYDGEQHFFYRDSGWDTQEHFQQTQERDTIKNQWCKDNNIPLIRIPYTHLKGLTLVDLQLETSQFIVS